MKKQIFFLLILCIFISGCSNGRNPAEEDASTESSGVFQWPTEKWSISSPEAQQIDSNLLNKADARIEENYPNIYSLLVVRHGFLVYEKYYRGMNEDSDNQVYSVTKSVMSALTGIALREKIITGTDQKVSELLPGYFSAIDNPKKKDITVKNVLTMSGGLETIDSDYAGYFTSGDWLDYAIKKPLTDEPGSKFTYNTGLTHFLSGIITEKSGMNTKEFADKYLFGPLNIKVKKWDIDRKGYYGGGSGLYLTPRDMAKFGFLYLNNGKWEDKQLIPQEWAAESTQKHIQPSDEVDYGYLFWIAPMTDKTRSKSYPTYRADGAGGQKIVVIPELDMLVVITANENSSSKDGADTQALIPDYILPAVN